MTAKRQLSADELAAQAMQMARDVLNDDSDAWVRGQMANTPTQDPSVALVLVRDASAVNVPEVEIPSTPNDEMSAAIVKAAPEVFALERMTSGMAAVLYEAVRRWKLYKAEGFNTMAEYAEVRLHVKSKASRKAYARAGSAMLQHFRTASMRAIESLTKGVTFVTPSGAPSSFPTVSVLRELPGAIRRTPPTEHVGLLKRVEEGEITYEELRHVGRDASPAKRDSDVDGEPIGEDDQDDTSSEETKSEPSVFHDVPDFEQVAHHLREAVGVLKPVVDSWTQNPGGSAVTTCDNLAPFDPATATKEQLEQLEFFKRAKAKHEADQAPARPIPPTIDEIRAWGALQPPPEVLPASSATSPDPPPFDPTKATPAQLAQLEFFKNSMAIHEAETKRTEPSAMEPAPSAPTVVSDKPRRARPRKAKATPAMSAVQHVGSLPEDVREDLLALLTLGDQIARVLVKLGPDRLAALRVYLQPK